MNDIRPGIFEISHILAPCPQKRGMDLPYRQFSFFPAPPDSIYEEAGRRASSPKQVGLKKMFSVSRSGRHLGKHGQRTILGVIRPGYAIRHSSCGRKRIYGTQRARETKVGKGVEYAICDGRSDDKRQGWAGAELRTHCSR